MAYSGVLGQLSPTAGSAVRAVGLFKSKIDSVNRLANLISEDISNISLEIDRISGSIPEKASQSCPERTDSCEMDAMQSQIDRIDRLAQETRRQLDRLRAI